MIIENSWEVKKENNKVTIFKTRCREINVPPVQSCLRYGTCTNNKVVGVYAIIDSKTCPRTKIYYKHWK